MQVPQLDNHIVVYSIDLMVYAYLSWLVAFAKAQTGQLWYIQGAAKVFP